MITSIGQFLDKMGVQSRFFDLGRHISELPAQHFERFEAGSIAYPAPYLHHAWVGLLFWDPETPDMPLLWFLKLPLDEQGKLQLASRDLFLKQLLTAVGTNLSAVKEGKQLQAVLEGNPFVFTPTPERQASLHAKIKQLLQQPPSQHYQTTCDYFQSDLQQWDQLAVQGIADLAIRWPEHQQALIDSIPSLPSAPLKSLCLCLENEAITGALCKPLIARLEQQAQVGKAEQDDELLAALVRACSRSLAVELRQKHLLTLLKDEPATSIEVLVAVATRCHMDLTDATICYAFLEQLARQPQNTFNRVLTDLLFLPMLRTQLIERFRQTDRSEQLATAIGGLLQANAVQAPGTVH